MDGVSAVWRRSSIALVVAMVAVFVAFAALVVIGSSTARVASADETSTTTTSEEPTTTTTEQPTTTTTTSDDPFPYGLRGGSSGGTSGSGGSSGGSSTTTTSTTTARPAGAGGSPSASGGNASTSNSSSSGGPPASQPALTPLPGAQPLSIPPFATDIPLGPLPALAVPALPTGAARSTKPVLDALQGMTYDTRLLTRILAPFPVAGEATYHDDYSAPVLPGAPPRTGVDVTADRDTPVIASATGAVHLLPQSGPDGNVAILTGPDGTAYHYTHLDRFAPQLNDSQRVLQGDVIGFLGTSPTPPLLGGIGFEVHPGAGAPVNPVPYLDRWLSQAVQTARAMASGRANEEGEPTDQGPAVRGEFSAASPQRSHKPGSSPTDTIPGLALIGVGVWWFIRRRRWPPIPPDEAWELRPHSGGVDPAS